MLIRLMTATDLVLCLPRSPVVGVSAQLALSVLTTAFEEKRLRGGVIQHPSTGKLVGFGLAGYARGADIHDWVRAGQPLVANHLLSESRAGRVYLGPPEIASAQRADDLHLVVVGYQPVDLQDPQVMEVLHAGHTVFRLMHEGHSLRGVWQEGLPSDAGWTSAIGFQVKHQAAGSDTEPRWLYGALRDDVPASWPSHTLSHVLHRRERRLGLSPAQCRVAELALWQMDDAQVAQELAISPATVRRHWRGIFDRLDASDALRQEGAGSVELPTHRGPERRGKVLDYLRSHLQEIRPA